MKIRHLGLFLTYLVVSRYLRDTASKMNLLLSEYHYSRDTSHLTASLGTLPESRQQTGGKLSSYMTLVM